MKKLLLLSVIIGLIACNNKDGLYRISLGDAISKTIELNPEDCMDSIQYVPLQTVDSGFIGNIAKVIRWKDYLYISDWESHLYLFDVSGKFVRMIGSQGRGPGEYLGIGDLLVNPENGDLSVMGGEKMLVFGIDGQLKEEVKLNSALQVGVFDGNGNMVFISPVASGLSDPFPLLYVCDKDGNVLEKLNGKREKIEVGIPFFNWIYCRNDKIYFKEEFSDTLCYMKQDYISHPYAIVDLGKCAFKPHLFDFKYENEWVQYYRLLGVWDFNHTMFLKVQKGLYGKDYTSFIYCKDKNVVGMLGNSMAKEGFIIDDILYTPVSGYENQLISWISSASLVDNDGIVQPELARIASTLTLESNPVLAMMYMK